MFAVVAAAAAVLFSAWSSANPTVVVSITGHLGLFNNLLIT